MGIAESVWTRNPPVAQKREKQGRHSYNLIKLRSLSGKTRH